MTLLKFDPTGCIHPDWGITAKRCDSLRDSLSAIRDELVAVSNQSPEDSFLQLPWQQHNAYQQHREESSLGRIFKIANSIHDDIDAVVVLGSESSLWAPRALMQACCDPYHNELSRAARGSKPRMYFCDNNLDCDSISALLNRLATRSGSPNTASDRWALIVIDDDEQLSALSIIVDTFIGTLKTSLRVDAKALMPRFVIPVAKNNGWLRNLATTIPCEVVIGLPAISDRYMALSAKTLMPAAMLGLDCMKLLGGAHQMTTHFAEATFSENLVLQFVAVNQLLNARRFRALKTWNHALAGIMRWYESTFPELSFCGVLQKPADHVIHQFAVQTPRCDPLMVEGQCKQDMLELSEAATSEMNRQWETACRPTTKVTLPNCEFVAIGELLQFLMIASAVETRCDQNTESLAKSARDALR